MNEWTTRDFIAWRERMNWSPRQAAEGLGVTYQNIWNIEAKPHDKPVKRLYRLACQHLELQAQIPRH